MGAAAAARGRGEWQVRYRRSCCVSRIGRRLCRPPVPRPRLVPLYTYIRSLVSAVLVFFFLFFDTFLPVPQSFLRQLLSHPHRLHLLPTLIAPSTVAEIRCEGEILRIDRVRGSAVLDDFRWGVETFGLESVDGVELESLEERFERLDRLGGGRGAPAAGGRGRGCHGRSLCGALSGDRIVWSKA
jgi:hypothetical protein